jgi:hypothetical protein
LFATDVHVVFEGWFIAPPGALKGQEDKGIGRGRAVRRYHSLPLTISHAPFVRSDVYNPNADISVATAPPPPLDY